MEGAGEEKQKTCEKKRGRSSENKVEKMMWGW